MGGGGGLYMGPHLCSPLCVYVKALKEYSRKETSLPQLHCKYYNKRDMSTLVLHGKVLRSMPEPWNVVFLLSIAFNELADASRLEKLSLCKGQYPQPASELCSCLWKDGVFLSPG